MDRLNELQVAHTGVEMGAKSTQPDAGLFGIWYRRALHLPNWAGIFWFIARLDGLTSSGTWQG
jgi:hypothetical protein